MASYAKLLSVFGIGVSLSEFQHSVLLTFALSVSVLVSAWRSVRARRAWPLLFALLGSSLVLLGHLHGELQSAEWAGVLVLLVAGVIEQARMSSSRVRLPTGA
jgi:hypothetical protein